jgi:hypothetical protein
MNLSNPVSGTAVRTRMDNVVHGPDGCLIVESLFSKVVDLSAATTNLAARIHPAKARAFLWIVTQECATITARDAGAKDPADDAVLKLVPEVEVHVNRPDGGIVVRRFSEFRGPARELLRAGAYKDVKSTTPIPGFDRPAEPVLRELKDGSLLLIFNCLPPLAVDDDPARAGRFDMARFGDQLQEALGIPVLWDDRDVFVIPRPKMTTEPRLRKFFQTFWGPRPANA